MRKIFTLLFALAALVTANAKVVKITLADNTTKVFTTSQLSSIDFNDDGTLTVTAYNGEVMEALGAEFTNLTIDEEATVYEMRNDTLHFSADLDGIPLDLHQDRPMKKINYVYPSTDPFGQPITMSGSILIPENIWEGEAASEGIILYNHYTIFNRIEAPTYGFATLEHMILANPLNPNYIVVESDFYGFGVTERFPQAFVQGTHNARASLDALLAARDLLTDMGVDYGPLTFNMGYSSGGFDALSTQKLRDMEYSDRISFDKTFAGGSPSDLKECYRQYVTIDSTAYNAVPLLLMVSTKETQNLDVDYESVFQPYVASRVDRLVISKNYSSWPVCDSIGREKKIHEILSEKYCDLNSEESMFIQDLFQKMSITTDWRPDPSQRMYIFHSRDDDYVPVQSARPVIGFLKDNGFKPSIIPGATNLQTNFVVKKMGHLTATLIYLIQTVAALKAWPMMYTDGQLNPAYQNIVQCSPVEMMRYLDSMGFDCRSVINAVMQKLSEQSGEMPEINFDPTVIQATLVQVLGSMGITMEELAEMKADSGVDLVTVLMEIMQYMNEVPAEPDGEAAQRAMYVEPQTPVVQYEQQLKQWLKMD